MFRKTPARICVGLVCLLFAGALTGFGFPTVEHPPADQATEEGATKPLETTVRASESVLEYKTDEEIEDIILGTTRMTVKEAESLGVAGIEHHNAWDTVDVLYAKVVVIGDRETKPGRHAESIRFLDQRGNTKKEVRLLENAPGKGWSTVIVSTNRKYMAVNNLYAIEGRKDRELLMLDDEGNELWRMKHHLATAIPSTNGKLVVGTGDPGWGEGPIYVYEEGRLIGQIQKDVPAWCVAFSMDGTWFVVTLVKRDREIRTESPIDRARADLIAFDDEVNELWRKEGIARGGAAMYCPVRISDNDTVTVMTGVGEYRIYQFDREGRLICEETGDLEQLRRFRE